MKFSSTFNFSILAAVAVAFVGTISTCYAGDPNARSEKDIPGVAMENGSFTTLVAALSATDLVGALSSPAGPFTVFAPTDDAFDLLPDGLVECLLEEDNLSILSDILLYHVASGEVGEVLSTDLSNGMTIPTLLQGQNVVVDLNNGNGRGVKINDSTVTTADVLATNGVIHIINSVLVPSNIDLGVYLNTCTTESEDYEYEVVEVTGDDDDDDDDSDLPGGDIIGDIFGDMFNPDGGDGDGSDAGDILGELDVESIGTAIGDAVGSFLGEDVGTIIGNAINSFVYVLGDLFANSGDGSSWLDGMSNGDGYRKRTRK
mmetsp:Transcript_35306/g.40138  ORF Transcript_35306/g.40138 Transcript_35306/m.40138 type:complete len:316 (+) Transcript_35306:93-1040(+)